MSKTPLNEENKELLTEEAQAAAEEKKDKKKKSRKSRNSKAKKIPENETEEERKEREKKEEEKKKKKPKDIKTATKRLLSYITQYKGLLFLVAVLVIATTVISVLASLAMLPVNKTLEELIAGNIVSGDEAMANIIKWLIIMAIAYALSALCNLLYSRIMLHISSRTLKNMRRDLFNHIQGLPLEYFDKRKTGQIMSHFTNDVRILSLMEYVEKVSCLILPKCLMTYVIKVKALKELRVQRKNISP